MTRRLVLPDIEPTSESEAQAMVTQLEAATTTEDPGPAEVLSKIALPGLTLANLRPQLPCEGPPVAFGLGLRWPNAVRDPIYIYSKKGKPHRQMELDYLPDSLPKVDVYVLKRRMEFDFLAKLKNLSAEIDIPEGQLKSTMDTIESDAQARLIDAMEKTSEAIPKDAVRDFLLHAAFEGTWALIKAIWEYLTTKKITVRLAVPIKLLGYETDEYIVDEFNKDFAVDVKLPVDQIKWHVW